MLSSKVNLIKLKTQLSLPVSYKGIELDCGYRIDMLIEEELILEIKSVEEIKGIHQAQILTYMKLANIKHGFIINFNVFLERLHIFAPIIKPATPKVPKGRFGVSWIAWLESF